jgi:hypothetical protein
MGSDAMQGTALSSATALPRRTAVLALLGLLLVLVGGGGTRPAEAAGAAQSAEVAASSTAAPGTRGKVAGYGVTTSAGGDKIVTAEAERMAAPGHNMVSLEATWAVRSATSNEVYRTAQTVPDQDLLLAARRVRQAGMNVMLTVKVFCEGCPPERSWRGELEPSNRAEFFRNYRAMSNHYAGIAQQAGAQIYFVGSEMNRVQDDAGAWRQVIFEARSRFSGKIGYQANWDALTGIDFWPEVDIAGVSAYFPLSDEMQPNISDLLAAWRNSDTEAHRGSNWLAQLEEFARGHGKPVLFGEVGYQSAIQAGQRPFFKDKFNGTDQQLQADLYQTALTLFEGRPWWLGAIWWEYLNTTAYEQDHDYSPRGKLAEELLTRWYAGQRPSSPERSLVGTTRPSARSARRRPPGRPSRPPRDPARPRPCRRRRARPRRRGARSPRQLPPPRRRRARSPCPAPWLRPRSCRQTRSRPATPRCWRPGRRCRRRSRSSRSRPSTTRWPGPPSASTTSA